MSELRYSVNGKYFKDFKVIVSDSFGLFDGLKRKKINTYDWAEYNGISPDLSNPRFEPREIILDCFVLGENWVEMKSNFDSIINEFQKSGTQRLLVEPFNKKPMPFEVFMDDSVELDKKFKEGEMVGVFRLKLIEPNPIKKVLYFMGSTLSLSYTSPNETEIFYGNGLKDVVKTNASISGKTLANRVVSDYNFTGRNYYKREMPETDGIYLSQGNGFKVTGKSGGNSKIRFGGVIKSNGIWTVSGYVRNNFAENLSFNIDVCDGAMQTKSFFGNGSFVRFEFSFTVNNYSDDIYNFVDIENIANSEYIFTEFKVEKNITSTAFTVAPENEKYIIIAGNVEEITNLTTNADVLWERL